MKEATEKEITKDIQQFLAENLQLKDYIVENIHLPWNRTFEVDFELVEKKD